MFKKLVSNLAYSPALVGQLGFYAKRLKKEEATRRIGLIFTALALVVQSFAVFSPPEAANASSPNDMIRGGVTTVSQYLGHYDANTNNIKDLFNVLGISRTNIAGAKKVQINSKDGYYSWGLNPHFSAAQGERSYTIKTSSGGLRTFYMRPLRLWDTGSNLTTGSYYYAFTGTTSSGMRFWLMLNCGNLTLKVIPPAPQCPTGTIGTYPNCTVPPKVTVQPKMCTIPGKEKLLASSPLCTPDPIATCKSLTVSPLTNNRYQFNSLSTTQYGAAVKSYTYTVKKDGQTIMTKTVLSSELSNTYIYSQTSPGTYTVTLTVGSSLGALSAPSCVKTFTVAPPEVCPVNPSLPKSSPECQPCPGDESLWIKDEKCEAAVVETKSAHNETQNVAASSAVARAGDRITYSINVENKGLAPTTVVVKENLADVLEYASVINNGSGSFSDKTLTWPAVTLKPGEKQTRMFTVQVNDKISSMGTGVSDKTSYDCKMTNTFGNTVEISVDCPVEKQVIEQTAAELPHTGPTENMIFAGVIFAVVSYFYARSRQLKKEVRLIRRDLNAGTI